MSEQNAPTIYVLQCPFNKRGFPVVGSFGSRIRNVVIIPIETWTKLCEDVPALGEIQFNVGSYGDDSEDQR